jgi:hypothetical protein
MSTQRRSSISYRHTAAETFCSPQQHTRARSAERTNEYNTAEEIPHQLEEFMIATAAFDDDDADGRLLLESSSGHQNHADGNRPRLASDTSISRQVNGMRRANSDPFECAGEEDMDELEQKLRRTSVIEEEDAALPTLNRFPFGETKNRNCWSEPPHHIFMVRGPNYLQDKKKLTSTQFILQARGCDLFLSDNPEQIDMSRYVRTNY